MTSKSQSLESTRAALRGNLKRLSSVSGEDEQGDLSRPVPMSQMGLSKPKHDSEGPAVSVSTLSKISSGETGSPTLKSICQIADALGVSPALLLMTTQDWKLLIAGVQRVLQIVTSPTSRIVAQVAEVCSDLERNKEDTARLIDGVRHIQQIVTNRSAGIADQVAEICAKLAGDQTDDALVKYGQAALLLGNDLIPKVDAIKGDPNIEREAIAELEEVAKAKILGIYKYSAMADLSVMSANESLFILILASVLGSRIDASDTRKQKDYDHGTPT